MFKYEKKLIDFIHENYLLIGFICATIMALFTRLCMISFESNDYIDYLSGWFEYLKTHGGLLALKNYPGDYNAPYMTIMALLTYLPFKKIYLIKMVSIIFDFGLAISACMLVRYLVPKNKDMYGFITYAVVLFLPEVVINSAIWGQCDSGYTMFVILALLYLLKEKYTKSFIFLGLAFSLKLQFIFILPLFIVVYVMKKKFSILNFLIIPLVNLVLCIPAMIFGKSFKDILLVYFKQVYNFGGVSRNFLNLYALISEDARILVYYGIFLTIFVCLFMLIYLIYKRVNLTNKMILNLGLWFLVIVTFLLPSMHERYLFAGSVLSVIYYIVYKENFALMIGIILSAIVTYFGFLFGIYGGLTNIIVIGYAVVVAYYTKDVFRMLNDGK